MILGAGVMQGPAIRIAGEMGLFTVVIDGDPDAPCKDLADRFECIDLKDKEGIEALGGILMAEGGLSGIMTAGTDFSASVAWAAEKLGLPGIPYEAALNASDKERMRDCFKKAGLPSPEFAVFSTPPLPDTALPAPYPLVVKPVDNMGGRGCRRVDSFAELSPAVAGALKFSRSGRAIVEGFIEGPEFSVDAIVYHGEITICGLADRHIFFPPYFIEMGHTMPSNFPAEQQKLLLDTFCAAVRALGIAGENSVGAAKGDIKLTPNGPMIGEVAARLSGGYMSGWTYPYASGVEPTQAMIQACTGRKPTGLVPGRSWTSAERAFISIPGVVASLQGVQAAREAPYVKDLFLRAAPGSPVTFPENNVSKCGNIITQAPNRQAAAEAAETAARSILIRLQAPNPETEAFLDGARHLFQNGARHLDAFQIFPALRSALDRLPGSYTAKGAPDDVDQINQNLAIIPFPEFSASDLRDYMGRTVEESLAAVRQITALPLPVVSPEEKTSDTKTIYLGRNFWSALIRGGYQAAVYMIDMMQK
jgi:biotin carboxylase